MDKTKYYVIGCLVCGAIGMPVLSTVSDTGIAQTAQHEGYKAKPYKDTGGVVTQGHGSTLRKDGSKIRMTDPPITRKEALNYLHAHINRYTPAFNKSLQNVQLSQAEYDLYADFVYQYGIRAWQQSSMLKNLKQGQYVKACKSLENWRFSRVGSQKVDCRLDHRCKGVWTRQQTRINKCLEVNL